MLKVLVNKLATLFIGDGFEVKVTDGETTRWLAARGEPQGKVAIKALQETDDEA